MPYFLYQFEAISIQEYIMSSSKLKEMVGASQLLEVLTSVFLKTTIQKLDLAEKDIGTLGVDLKLSDNEILFPRKAGGVFLAIMKEGKKSELFKQLWPIVVQQLAPGLKFSVASSSGTDIKKAIEEVRNQLNAEKNTPKVSLPEMTPLTMRSPRTGGAAINTVKNVSIDYPTQVKNKTQDEAKELFQIVSKKWLPKSEQDRIFPNIFEHNRASENETEFPFSGKAGEHTIAIIHADGNGVGQYIQDFFNEIKKDNVNDLDFLKAYSTFSQGLDNATQTAAQSAMQWLLNKYDQDKQDKKKALPIRPLILSGDDVTCIIRSDYAFEFMQILTQEFEKSSKKELDKLEIAQNVFPDYLTITTGMVFLRSNQPFYMGYQLAEDLCRRSKKEGRKAKIENTSTPSTISFVHATNTLFDSVETFISQELTTKHNQKLTNTLYHLGEQENPNLVHFNVLKELTECFSDSTLNISFIRKLATTLQLDPTHAKTMIKRWQEINQTEHIEKFESLLKTHFKLENLEALCEHDKDNPKSNPISDLIAYQAISTGAYHD